MSWSGRTNLGGAGQHGGFAAREVPTDGLLEVIAAKWYCLSNHRIGTMVDLPPLVAAGDVPRDWVGLGDMAAVRTGAAGVEDGSAGPCPGQG